MSRETRFIDEAERQDVHVMLDNTVQT